MVTLSKEQFNAISQVIQHTYEQQRIRPCDIKRLEVFRMYLERICQVSLNCFVDIFGSTKNGFGTRNSDIDLCLHLDPYSVVTQQFVHRQSRNICMSNIPYNAAILLGLAYELQKTRNFKQLTAILSARVPVLKLSCGPCFNGLQADLTICNEVAIYNTKLLESYGKLDKRVPQLGVALKVWMKCCNISGASEGWLSSYAYIIMLIHFLQTSEKPVLPFLQQVSPPMKPKKPVLIGEWDVYFYNPTEMTWLSPNSQTVAELWLGFFAYYAWVFDFANEVVQIRHPKKLGKKRKGWEASPLAVEDPFVLNHNLGATVDAEALLHIKETFALTYYHFVNGFFLRCGKELDFSHARSLYRKFDSVKNDDALTVCSICHGSDHNNAACSYRDFFGSERSLKIQRAKESNGKEHEDASASSVDSNSLSDSGVSSLCSDVDNIILGDSKSLINLTEPIDEQLVAEITRDSEGISEMSNLVSLPYDVKIYSPLLGVVDSNKFPTVRDESPLAGEQMFLLPHSAKPFDGSTVLSQKMRKLKSVAGNLFLTNQPFFRYFVGGNLVASVSSRINLNSSLPEHEVDFINDEVHVSSGSYMFQPLVVRFYSAANRQLWCCRFLFVNFQTFVRRVMFLAMTSLEGLFNLISVSRVLRKFG